MDFSKLGTPIPAARPVDPIRIFERLPNLPGTPNDLWRGQADALQQWHAARTQRDVLISLNTGAGKTLVGLLVAQSLTNEGIDNVVYICATIDLVRQTSLEAKKIGLEHTTRVRSTFDNDLFESGNGFCITTYHALFNGLSAIRRRHFPGAVIFDDAHVAEAIIRDALTLQISSSEHPQLFKDLVELFRPHFRELRIEGRFNDSLTMEHASIVMAAPGGLLERRERLIELFERRGMKNDDQKKFSYAYLRDKIDCCGALFGRGVFELAPPFLPSLALDVFERPVRRIYLSATLRSRADFVRAFGRLPDRSIEPDNDAGNGERLILYGRAIPDDVSPDLVRAISNKHKTLLAVPTYYSARKWEDVAKPPEPRDFSSRLDAFRESKKGTFILVSRVDGIDLPHDTCRIMILDGLPSGTSLMERYQWEFLQMSNSHATRLANRLVQLFGRINRGRNDYGVFLVAGSELNAWLNKDRNVALLPSLLQRQIVLGRTVQEGMGIKSKDKVIAAVSSVISREPSWLDYYGETIKRGELDQDQVSRTEEAEPQMVSAAKAEALYAAAMWNGDVQDARNHLDRAMEETARVDTLLAGWESVWFGASLEIEHDLESARLAYCRAVIRLGSNMVLPRSSSLTLESAKKDDTSKFAKDIYRIVSLSSNDSFDKEIRRIRSQLIDLDGASPRRMEESVRALGEQLGFSATRPDNDFGTGPDVLWLDEATRDCLAFELKTDKDDPATYRKKEIAQGHDHLSWVLECQKDCRCLGLLFVGPSGQVESKANPSDAMWLCAPATLKALRDRLLALVNDLRAPTPVERSKKVEEACDDGSWTIGSLFADLQEQTMKDLQAT